MGTWIEILCRGRVPDLPPVVPLVGMWIEILNLADEVKKGMVVPLVETWIEITPTMRAI